MNQIKIDKNRCKACYLCIGVCPKGLIIKGGEANSLGAFPVVFSDEKKECLGCALCAMRCPDMAITEVVKGKK